MVCGRRWIYHPDHIRRVFGTNVELSVDFHPKLTPWGLNSTTHRPTDQVEIKKAASVRSNTLHGSSMLFHCSFQNSFFIVASIGVAYDTGEIHLRKFTA